LGLSCTEIKENDELLSKSMILTLPLRISRRKEHHGWKTVLDRELITASPFSILRQQKASL
jgi:hypothetical protein